MQRPLPYRGLHAARRNEAGDSLDGLPRSLTPTQSRHRLEDGTPAHSFSTLMAELGSIVRNTCRTPRAGPEAPTFDLPTIPNPKQRRALELVEQIGV